MRKLLLTAAVTLISAGAASAQTFSFTTLTTPGDTTVSELVAVNRSGTAVGTYKDAAGRPHGMYYQSSTGAWLTVDAPNGAMGTVVKGINKRNQLVGFYKDATGNAHGMLVTVSE
jgi:hypothetical protein